jgi:hypothetical protein
VGAVVKMDQGRRPGMVFSNLVKSSKEAIGGGYQIPGNPQQVVGGFFWHGFGSATWVLDYSLTYPSLPRQI